MSPRAAPRDLHAGYGPQDLVDNPLLPFYRPALAPLPPHVQNALLTGVRPTELLPGADQAHTLLNDGDWPVETGYTFRRDGAAHVFCLTRMPGVTPAMWDWWFAWHGSDPRRYKLWHPQSHLHVAWADGRDDLAHYVGRTSNVVELIGNRRQRFSIGFVPPADVGLDEDLLARRGEIAVCADAGITGLPAVGGRMVHHLRLTHDGCEMRSRFWLAGGNVRLLGMPSPLDAWLGAAAGWLAQPSERDARELLVHCAQEMNHLAAILPALYNAFGPGLDYADTATTARADRRVPAPPRAASQHATAE